MRDEPNLEAPTLDPAEILADRRVEELLAQKLAARGSDEALPPGFTERLMAERSFAPWEVRQARSWRLPAVMGGTLLSLSFAAGLTPLLRLGPATALAVWTELVLYSLSRPIEAFAASGPILAEATARLGEAAPPGTAWAFGTLAGLAIAPLGLWALRRRSRWAPGLVPGPGR